MIAQLARHTARLLSEPVGAMRHLQVLGNRYMSVEGVKGFKDREAAAEVCKHFLRHGLLLKQTPSRDSVTGMFVC
jgi:hypothetical protein